MTAFEMRCSGWSSAVSSSDLDGVRYGPCVTGTRHFVAIGLNYADHAAESNLPIPEEPVVFNKWVSCIQGPNDPVTIPKDSQKTDWEVELGVVIGTRASYVTEADALSDRKSTRLNSSH